MVKIIEEENKKEFMCEVCQAIYSDVGDAFNCEKRGHKIE